MAPPGEDEATANDEELMAEWEAAAADGPGAEGDEEFDEEDAEAMAAEWEAMLGGGEEDDVAAAMGGESARVLNQDEIDSLLGFDDAADDGTDRAGIQAILNSALVSYERLPMLEVVFDRLVRMMTTSLRNFTSDNVEVSLDDILSQRFGDYLNSIPLPAMLTVFKAEEWDNYGIMTVDTSMIYSIVDAVSHTHLRPHETKANPRRRPLLENKKHNET